VIERLVLFGATGDLAGRYLLPALAALSAGGQLPDGFEVVGAAQQDWDDDAFRKAAAEQLAEHGADVPESARDAVVRMLRYRQVDLDDKGSVARAVCPDPAGTPETTAGDPVAVYLALPTRLFTPAVSALGALGLPEGSRIALEKPFGDNLESAIALNRLLVDVTGVAGEHEVFRVDHFLGLATVQNLLGMRLANRVLEPVWNSAHIEQVEIVWEETLGLEGRAAYYDRAGQLKDMVQNHLLQVLCLVAMEPPASLGERDLRDRKLDVLRSVCPLRPEQMTARTRRARYTAGRLGDRDVPDYVDEEGVDPARGTETFAEVELELDSWRWTGTRFLLRTAKAMGRERQEVVVRFRPVPRLPFGDAAPPPPNELRIGLDVNEPGDLVLHLTGHAAGSPPQLLPLTLSAELPVPELTEYSRVLLDILDGDSNLSIRGDEAEQSWRIVTPVLEAWAAGEVPLEEYPAGSDGPPPR
jgi:glucose-6-phosphate 1-dehydrogenase